MEDFVDIEDLFPTPDFQNDLLAPQPEIFNTKAQAVEYCKVWASSHGYAITIRTSKRNKKGEEVAVYLQCDRGGNPKPFPSNSNTRNTGSRRIGCPFETVIRCNSSTAGDWRVEIKNPYHNHEASMDPAGHPSLRIRTQAINNQIKHLTTAGVPPKQILSSIRLAHPDVNIIAKDVYNQRLVLRQENLGRRTPIQTMMDVLQESAFI